MVNRLIETTRTGITRQHIDDGLGNRVGQTAGLTTNFALGLQDLPEVIYTSGRNVYLYLLGVILAENDSGEQPSLLVDGLGGVRQVVDEEAAAVLRTYFGSAP